MYVNVSEVYINMLTNYRQTEKGLFLELDKKKFKPTFFFFN